MAYETLILSREERFAVVTLNRPPANAISETLMRELNAALSELEADDGVRAVIITGAGDKIFCAGADLGSAFQGADVGAFIRFGNDVVRRIERFPKPVVAAINGHALGGGCEIAMGCHIRILKETARMGQTESNLGITPGFGGTQRYPRLIGRGLAQEHLILGTQIPAAECYRTGLVNRLSKEGETLNDAKALARELAKRPSPPGSSSRRWTRASTRRSSRPSRSKSGRSFRPSRPKTRPRVSRPSSRSVPPTSRADRVDLGIKGKTALVTGGARSLGKQDCLALAAEGCKVIVEGGTARGYAADITERAVLGDVLRRAESEVGPVDICVNNAGWIYTMGQLKDTADEDWDLNLRINLTGTYNVTKLVFPGMRERRWGRVICMASIAGLMGGFGQSAYSTSKMGVIGFAKSVALEGARYNVTSNVIAPGIVGPNANLSPLYDRMVKRVAMQREGQPEDIASAVAFLCSERARYITGAVLTVTGGMDLFTF
jgi:enoyl-CoA hydratase/carnithine racemase/NAD(P)-dependent dehydrogenase (short-subunit alcohol dehydrogenase family)